MLGAALAGHVEQRIWLVCGVWVKFFYSAAWENGPNTGSAPHYPFGRPHESRRLEKWSQLVQEIFMNLGLGLVGVVWLHLYDRVRAIAEGSNIADGILNET